MIHQNMVGRFCYLWLLSTLFPIIVSKPILAQSNIVPDTTLGNESSVVESLDIFSFPIDLIYNGAVRGINQFHSFKEFNVASDRGAYFFNQNNDIQNILARVTGDRRSEIFGTLGILNDAGITSRPNLFLINPKGIIFGTNASLDVPASFIATTANAIELGDKGIFHASVPEKSNLLSVNPSAFFFNAVPAGAIINQSQARQTVLQEQLGFSINVPPIIEGLQVLNGKSLLLVGGDITIASGILTALEGKVGMTSVAGNGLVSLSQTDEDLTLGHEGVQNFGDIKLSGDIEQASFALVNTTGEKGGNIQIQGRQLLLENGSFLVTGARNASEGGAIFIRTTDTVTVDDSVIGGIVDFGTRGNSGSINIETKKLNVIGGISNFGGFISTATSGEGNAGDITIKAEQVSLTKGGEIQAATFAQGNAGNITINASDFVEIIGKSSFDQNLSTITTQVNSSASGTGGNLLIDTKRLLIQDGAQVQAGTFGTGKGGNLTIIAPESVEIIGTDGDGSPSGVFTATYGAADAGDLTINTGKLSVVNGGTVAASTLAVLGEGRGGNLTITAQDSVEVIGSSAKNSQGTQFFSSLVTETGRLLNFAVGLEPALGGDLTINTGQLTISDGGLVSTSTYELAGKAGNLTVIAKEAVEVIGKDTNGNISSLTAQSIGIGNAGNLTINTGNLIIQDGGEISARTTGLGKGGDMRIQANSGYLNNRAVLTSRSERELGNAGNIFLNINDSLQLNNSDISTASDQSTGGAINITAKDIRLSGDSDITTSVFSGVGGGGDIVLTANSIIAFDDSDILAFARDGKGGNITLNTPAFFGFRYQAAPPNTNPTTLDGNNRVDINASGAVSGIITLPDTSFIQNSLTELQQNPIDTNALIANSCIARSSRQNGTFIITGASGLPNRPGDMAISAYPTGDVRNVPTNTTSRSWKKGDRIIEPSGVYRLANGQLVLSRECQ